MRNHPYPVTIIPGRLFLNRVEVEALILHDSREIHVSSHVHPADLELVVSAALRIVAREADRPGPFAHIHEQTGDVENARALQC